MATVVMGAIAAPAGAADIDVNTTLDMTADDNQCSLREAVNAANSNTVQGPSGGPDCPAGEATLDRVLLDTGVTYGFTSGTADDVNATGDIDVTGGGPVSIEGTGSPAPTIDSNDQDRAIDALDVTPGDTLTLNGIRITDNRVLAGDGGGVRVNPSTTVNVTNTTISQNIAGGAAAVGFHQGGGIRVDGTLNMSSSVVFDNDAQTGDAANSATGGGIEVTDTGTANITGSVIAANGVITPSNVTAINGAGINNSNGDLVLRNSTVSGNGISGGQVGSRRGAGIALISNATAKIVSSTISGNTGAAEGGGVYVGQEPPVQIIQSTIDGNSATGSGDAIQQDNGGAVPDVTVRGSVLSSPDASKVCGLDTSVLASGDHNVARGTTCGLAMGNDLQGVDPLLGALADNSGPSVGAPGFTQVLQTQAVSMGTPPFDHVGLGACSDELFVPLTADQRGSPRPSPAGGRCDSGAFELFVPATAIATPPTTSTTENPECAVLRAKLKRTKKKKKRKKIRRRLRQLGC